MLPVRTLVADSDRWKWKRGDEVEVEIDVLRIGLKVDDPQAYQPQEQHTGRQECQEPRQPAVSYNSLRSLMNSSTRRVVQRDVDAYQKKTREWA